MRLNGRFYFKKNISGNLFGEYSNNNTNLIESETCVSINSIENSFIGDYFTTWTENFKSNSSYLRIEIKENTKNSIYSITWAIDKDFINTIYNGEGFIVDDILIGNYLGK